jgi:predicted nucleotidyltransferase
MVSGTRSDSAAGSRVSLATVRRHRGAILRIAAKRGVRNVRVFGSVARGEATDFSDVDLLVDLEPGKSLLDLGAFQVDVQDLLAHRVDVVTTAGLRGRVGDHAADDVLPL